MPILGAIAGIALNALSKKKGKESTSGTQNQKTTQNRTGRSEAELQSDLLEQILSRSSTNSGFGQTSTATGTTGNTGTIRKGSAQTNQSIQQLIANVSGGLNRYSKDAAITDSKEGVTAAIQEVLAMGLPEIRTNATQAGGYNSTTRQLLTDNLVAQATAAGAKTRQDTINAYAQTQGQGVALLNQLLELSQGAETSTEETELTALTEDVTGEETSTATEDSTSTSTGTERQTTLEEELATSESDTKQTGNVSSSGNTPLLSGLGELASILKK